MRHAARAEEARLTQVGPVLELVDHHEYARIELAMKRAAGGKRYDVGDADALERVDIGAIVDARRRKPVAAAVACEKHGLRTADAAEPERVRRIAPRRRDRLLSNVL